MLQRIQTVYLFLVAVLATTMYFLPLLFVIAKPKTYYIFPYFTASLVLLTSLITIFLYKNRKLQIKLSIVNIVFLLLTFVEAFFINYQKTNYVLLYSFDIGAILPLISIIFTILAIKFIKKDEKLVKSLYRLR